MYTFEPTNKITNLNGLLIFLAYTWLMRTADDKAAALLPSLQGSIWLISLLFDKLLRIGSDQPLQHTILTHGRGQETQGWAESWTTKS